MAYNLTALGDVGSIYGLMVYSNNAANSLLFLFLVLALFFVMLLALKRFEFGNALLVSSWICFLISAIFVYAELLSLIWALLFLAMAAFTALFMFMTQN